jgi:hypothetical protein
MEVMLTVNGGTHAFEVVAQPGAYPQSGGSELAGQIDATPLPQADVDDNDVRIVR